MPAPRQEVASVEARGGVLVIGGFDQQRRSTDTVYTFAVREWGSIAPLPRRVDHAAAAFFDNSVFVAGGYSDGPPQSAVYRLDPEGKWVSPAPLHHARGALALVVVGTRLLALGGAGPAGDVSQVEAYEPVTNSWTDIAMLPSPRNHVAGFAYRGLACVAGGRAPNVARIDCLDPASGAWSRLPDLPVATSGAGAGVIGDQVVVAGGENAGESFLVPTVFRLVGQAWTSEPMLVPRHGIQLTPFAGRLWACGGATAAGYAATALCTSIG